MPTLSLRPLTLVAGDEAKVELVVAVDEPIAVATIEVLLEITEQVESQPGVHTLYRRTVTVVQGGILPVGTHQLQATFDMPVTCPPTHETTPGIVKARLHGVLRPMAGNASHAFIYPPIRRITPGPIEREPIVERTEDGGLEISLASGRVAVGELMLGYLRVTTWSDAPQEITIQLIAGSAKQPGTWGWRKRTYVVPANSIDRGIPIEFDLPREMPPTFESVLHTREWHLRIVRGPGSSALEIPIDVVDPEEPPPMATAAPSLGRDELVTPYEQLGPAWTLLDPPIEIAQRGLLRPGVIRSEGPCELVMGCIHEHETGLILFARVTFPSLGLGLRVEPSGRLRELFARDIQAGITAWDRTHRVTAEHRARAEAYVTATVPTLLEMSLPPLASWDDGHMAFARPIDWVTAAELEELAGALIHVARAHGTAAPTDGPYR